MSGERVRSARLRGKSGDDGQRGVAQRGPGDGRVPPLVAAVPGVAAHDAAEATIVAAVPPPEGIVFAGVENGEVAGLLHRSEGEVVVVVLAGDDAPVDLIRACGAGVERAVGVEGEGKRVIGRVDFDARFAFRLPRRCRGRRARRRGRSRG